MTTVLTYGTFDLFHIGHVRLFRRLRDLGSRLVVGVSTDEFNAQKAKKAVIPFEHRIEIVRAVSLVDEAFPEHAWDQKPSDIKKYAADVLAMGDDWQGKFDHFRDLCQVVYLPRTEGVSSTELRTALKAFRSDRLTELKNALEIIGAIVDELGE